PDAAEPAGDPGHPDAAEPVGYPDGSEPVGYPGYVPAQQDTGAYAHLQGEPHVQDGQEETGGYTAVPQQGYGEWEARQQYQGADHGQYQQGQDAGQYYQPDPYQQQDAYQQQDGYPQQDAYDPYGYAQQQPYGTGTGEAAPY
ncbi:hypothetical protein, partial [Streptomyces exfoliatus]|uniref:hypothetical protein n=1 Tax=Streptomyces exfoliatus TaxID=1905 RepID=UPI00055ED111